MIDYAIETCERKNLCVECNDKECIFAGKIESDCPMYKCNNNCTCENCEFIKQFQKEMRKEKADD